MWNESSAKPCTRILFLQILLGVLLLGGVFLLAVNEDIAATQRTMVNTVNYVKEQCNRYSRIGLADESKSLMRIVESANQTAHRLEEATRPVSADFLHTCVKDCYVSGILLLDEAGNITAASEAADMAAFVHENLDSEALLNTAQYPEKRYAVRLFCPEGCYLDLAAVQRLDAPGIVVAYYHTPLDYINSFSLSISSLLSGYDPAENGTIVVSSGNEIIASNEESFIGRNTDASAVLEEIRAASVSDRLVSAVAVHGRTREQYYSGKADWDIIREVKAAVQIPVIGNGDIFTPQDAKNLLEHTGCDAIMVGRGAQGNPWIFKRILHYLKTGELLPEPTAQERVEKALRHSQMLIAYKGEYVGIREMRKHMAWYMKGLPGAAELRGKLNYAETMAEMEALLNEYLKNHQ